MIWARKLRVLYNEMTFVSGTLEQPCVSGISGKWKGSKRDRTKPRIQVKGGR